MDRGNAMDIDEVRDIFGKCEVFQGLDDSLLGLLLLTAKPVSFDEGEIIYEEGDEAGGTFALIASGKASAVTQSGFVADELCTGEIIGEIGTISQQGQRTITIKALTPTRILEWDIEEVRQKSPELITKLKDLAWKRIKSGFV